MHEDKSVLRSGGTDRSNDAIAAIKDGSGDGDQTTFYFAVFHGITLTAVHFESVAEIAWVVAGVGSVTVHAPATEDGADFGVGEPRENGAAKSSAMRGDEVAGKQTNGEERAGEVDGVEADDTASAGNRENGSFTGAARELDEKRARVVGQGAPKDGAGAERVEFEAEALFFVVRIPLDQMKFLKCAEETVHGGLVQTESRGELGERHIRTVFSQVKQNADGLLQRFAGSCAARLPGQGAFTMG
jgi:hypothetical protein